MKRLLLCILATAFVASCGNKGPEQQPGESNDPSTETEQGLKPWDDGQPVFSATKGMKGYIAFKQDGVQRKAFLKVIDGAEIKVDADGYITRVGDYIFKDGKYVYEETEAEFLSISLNDKGLVHEITEEEMFLTDLGEEKISEQSTFTYDSDNHLTSVKSVKKTTSKILNATYEETCTLAWEGGLVKELTIKATDTVNESGMDPKVSEFGAKRTYKYDEYLNPLSLMPLALVKNIFLNEMVLCSVLAQSGAFGVAPYKFPASSSFIMDGSKTPSDTDYYIEYDEIVGAIPVVENGCEKEYTFPSAE